MDILYTVDEKYLQAIEELNYGELPKALHYFNEIINIDPDYARAYYQLGCFYYYQFKNYQTAGYYFKKCIMLEAEFPDVYVHYLKLLITLKMYKSVELIAEKAFAVPGVCTAEIYEHLGLNAEMQQDFATAKEQYKLAVLVAASDTEHNLFKDHLKRVNDKLRTNKSMIYAYQG
ncbi:MAG: hypothetical protein P0Y49_05205 [Candidatus Pedobacter colombiensis]|uniref:Tetratricopeptide repeat protein n=1 Tax=Candidatus Pedobacter colombiensis TaxID=3121371 RepID=A0AAJ5WBQ6_9SPHI|nr:hypothetical protein [Pedobacter sp.]WEK20534.1 MAG: hypothetical protein P0Y49_05205 [Pedobacter sp.]